MVKMMPEFQAAVGVAAIVTSQALMADPINMPEAGVNELYSSAARTAIRLIEDGDNHFKGQMIDARTHRLSEFEFELNEDGSISDLTYPSRFYSNGLTEEKLLIDIDGENIGDKYAIKPDEIVRELHGQNHSIDPEQTQTLEALMLASPDVWPFAGGQPATGDIARIAKTENGNMMGTCIIIPNVDADKLDTESQAALCIVKEFNENATITTNVTMHVATENGLVSSPIVIDDKIGWFEGPGDANTSGPTVSENIDRGLSQGLTYGNPGVM